MSPTPFINALMQGLEGVEAVLTATQNMLADNGN